MKRRHMELLSNIFFIIITSVVMIILVINTDRMSETFGEKIKYLCEAILLIWLYLWIRLDYYLITKLTAKKKTKNSITPKR